MIDFANVNFEVGLQQISLVETPATGKNKILNKYPDLAVAIDWKKLYSLALETTLDTKVRKFQYKILNLIIFTSSVQNGGFPFKCLLQY